MFRPKTMPIIQTIFYIVGIIFFLVVIIAAFIMIRATLRTTNAVKKLLTSKDIESLIERVKNRITPLLNVVANV